MCSSLSSVESTQGRPCTVHVLPCISLYWPASIHLTACAWYMGQENVNNKGGQEGAGLMNFSVQLRPHIHPVCWLMHRYIELANLYLKIVPISVHYLSLYRIPTVVPTGPSLNRLLWRGGVPQSNQLLMNISNHIDVDAQKESVGQCYYSPWWSEVTENEVRNNRGDDNGNRGSKPLENVVSVLHHSRHNQPS